MDRLAIESDILDTALEVIRREAGLRMDIIEREGTKKGKPVDAIVQLHQQRTQLLVETKRWAAQANLGAIINQINTLTEPGHGLFVADYINPKMGERLKEAEIQYIDTAGNAYINQPPVYIYVKGNKPDKLVAEKRGVKPGRAFQPTGMKVIFAFLKDKALINAPYREIADQAQVALGAVGWVIRDLLDQGLLLEGIRKNQRKLADFDLLLDKWVEAYPIKLKEKYKLGIYTTENDNWWKDIKPEKFGAQWGGEVAAAKYTNYLNPKHAQLYIEKNNMGKFLQAARLKKPEPGVKPHIEIELYKRFWTETTPNGHPKHKELAHPVIVYANLIATAEARNLDTAKRLREKYLC